MAAWVSALQGYWDVYRAQLKVTVATQLQYRMSLVIWLIGLVLQPVVYLVVWTTVARSGGGRVGGYGEADFAAYFLVSMLVNHLTFTWIAFEFEFQIREGQLSSKLLRPIHPIHGYVADNITYKLLTLIVMIPATIALALAFRPSLSPQPWQVGAFLVALCLAFLLRFCAEWTLALCAFWTTRVFAINDMYYLAFLFLAGQMAPLTLFPLPVQAVAAVLPFRWMLAFPTELLLGRLAPRDALIGLGAQLVWAALVFGVLELVWRRGVRRYSAFGA